MYSVQQNTGIHSTSKWQFSFRSRAGRVPIHQLFASLRIAVDDSLLLQDGHHAGRPPSYSFNVFGGGVPDRDLGWGEGGGEGGAEVGGRRVGVRGVGRGGGGEGWRVCDK